MREDTLALFMGRLKWYPKTKCVSPVKQGVSTKIGADFARIIAEVGKIFRVESKQRCRSY